MFKNKFKILIVEDNPVDMKSLVGILNNMGEDFEVRTAGSCQEAEEDFQKVVPDLVLLDIYLPDRDGFYFLKEVHQNGHEDIPVILITAFLNEDDKLKGFALGATDFIHKPVVAEEFKARVALQIRLKKIMDDHLWASQKTNEGIKILYKELENKNKQLEQLDHLKDEFVNNVSHELRTPLTIIQESISIITDGLLGEINEKQNKQLKVSLENVDRLGKIINDLLDISTIENGKLKLYKEEVNIVDLVQNVVSNFTTLVQKKGLEIKCLVPEAQVNVFIDKERIIQVLVNLVNNAYKFTDKGSIEVSVVENENTVECRVKDTGIGMSSSDIPRLFSKFDQIGRQSGAGAKGTGLGLSIAKGIIEAHHGQIKVESKLGEGTLFTIILSPSRIPKQYRNLMDCLSEVTQECNDYSVIAIAIKDPDGRKDELLNELELLIKEQLYRKADKIVRDEASLYVVLIHTKKEDALILMNRIRKTINEKSGQELFNNFKGFDFKIVSFPEDISP